MSLGKHFLLDIYGCKNKSLHDPNVVQVIIEEVASAMSATIVSSHFHHFSPLGVSGVLIISESHITVHTWPEYDYAAIDVFSCGELNMDAGIEKIKELFDTHEVKIFFTSRGQNLNGT